MALSYLYFHISLCAVLIQHSNFGREGNPLPIPPLTNTTGFQKGKANRAPHHSSYGRAPSHILLNEPTFPLKPLQLLAEKHQLIPQVKLEPVTLLPSSQCLLRRHSYSQKCDLIQCLTTESSPGKTKATQAHCLYD